MTHVEATKPLDRLPLGQNVEAKNRFMMGPLTNLQSHADGTLSDEEHYWLILRAKGGFGMTMTCAATVQPNGQGWPGQLGVYDDKHLPGLKRLAADIKSEGSLALVQLYHGGLRADGEVTGLDLISASENEKYQAREMTATEINETITAFVDAAKRCQKAGFDGVELHGAHGYLICQFLSPKHNQRTDEYGGDATARALFLKQILAGIRAGCGPDFIVGVRLSAERWGLALKDMMDLAEDIMAEGSIQFLDMSLWDCFKEPEEEAFKGKPLIDWYSGLERNGVQLGVAGNLRTADDVKRAVAAGVDFVILGRSAILQHDFPKRYAMDENFTARTTPVSPDVLRQEGLSDGFITYMRNWDGFVADA